MHSIDHMPKDIACWGDTDNMDMNLKAAELAHKNWIKQQGGKTNQGPAVQKSMMIHTLRKEASALCCEAVQGASRTICITYIIYIKHIKCIIILYCTGCTARIKDCDHGYESDEWKTYATVELDSPSY